MIALLLTIYLLILAGALVRVTGSGMGCPDWPRCFEQFVPPTSESQLRPDYIEYYSQKTGHEIAPFNLYHTYTEYVNRLIAVFTGLIAIGMLVFSFSYKNENKKMIYFSIMVLLAIGFEGWLGKKVVSSNLKEFVVSLHMLVSLIIVFMLTYLAVASQAFKSIEVKPLPLLRNLSLVLVVLTAIQILFGTQVRENLDSIAKRIDDRSLWFNHIEISFYIHRTFSWVLLLASFYLYFKSKQIQPAIFNASKYLLITTLLQIITGVFMYYFAVPKAAQATHLLIGCISFGLLCFINIQLNPKVKEVIASS